MKNKKISIALGADHAGCSLKKELITILEKLGYDTIDLGAYSTDSVDYPDFAEKVARLVSQHKVDKGILTCGSGIGMSIAANKVKGVRAALAWNTTTAQLAAEHNWANVLCLSARLVSISKNKLILKKWLSTANDLDKRHQRRIKKIAKIEAKK